MKVFTNYKKLLVSSCALTLALCRGESWSATVEEELKKEDIIIPCLFPKPKSVAQSTSLITSMLYDGGRVDQHMRESLVKTGEDGRTAVSGTLKFPYTTHVYFVAKFPNQDVGRVIGSGSFIHPQIILTAAHNVYNPDRGGLYDRLQCTAAANQSYAPFGFDKVLGVKIATKYLANIYDYDHDYALVFLEKPTGEETGCFGIASIDNIISNPLINSKRKFVISGYPGDKLGDGKLTQPTLWEMEGKISIFSPERLQYEIDTSPGQSGSGIWFKAKGKDKNKSEYYLVGVHAYGIDKDTGRDYNSGPYLNKNKLAEILGWINEFKESKLKFDDPPRPAKDVQEGDDDKEDLSGVSVRKLLDEKEFSHNWLVKAKVYDRAKFQYKIGEDYLTDGGISGKDSEKNNEDGVYWIKKAAKNSVLEKQNAQPTDDQIHSIKAQRDLARMYKMGENGLLKNTTKAIKWLSKAAYNDHKIAQYDLANTYLYEEKKDKLAFKWFERASEEGHQVAHFEAQNKLGDMYRKGIGVQQNYKEAVNWYNKSIERAQGDGQESSKSQNSLGEMYRDGKGVPQSYKEAIRFFKEATKNNNYKAQNNLGEMYREGRGVAKDEKKAVELFQTAAVQGNAEAQYNLGLMQEKGLGGLPKNDAEALKWYQKSADRGDSEESKIENPQAQYKLGLMYEEGRGGLPQDAARALEWYQKAGEKGNPKAQYKLGFIYRLGQSVPINYEEAVKWFTKASNQHYKNSLDQLAEMYQQGLEGNKLLSEIFQKEFTKDNGQLYWMLGEIFENGHGGLEQSDTQAVEWYQKSVEQRSAEGQWRLGLMYEKGLGGLEQSDTEALKWYQKSADQENAEGQWRLGLMYEKGLGGLEQNDNQAVKWYKKSTGQGNAEGRWRLGLMYEKGLGGLVKNIKEAFMWYQKAADQNHKGAILKLSEMYKKAVEGNAELLSFFNEAEKEGDSQLQSIIGEIFQNWHGIQKNEEKALEWYKKAAAQENPEAQYKLGLMHEKGLGGLPKDEAEAVNWYKKAAAQENPEAQYKLGFMHEKGRGGLPKDEAEAVNWYKKAADQENPEAQYKLGLLHYNGEAGLTVDYIEASQLIRESAHQGNIDAQNLLSIMYQKGQGVLADATKALEWHDKAVKNGYIGFKLYVDENHPSTGTGTISDPFQKLEDAVDHVDPTTNTLIEIFAGRYANAGRSFPKAPKGATIIFKASNNKVIIGNSLP